MKKDNRRGSSQAIDEELTKVISEHLKQDMEMTVRSLVRHMKLVKNASSITRCPKRMLLINKAKIQQQESRGIAANIFKNSNKQNSERIVKLELELAASLAREKNLRIAFLALIKASAIHGVSWVSLFERYQLDIESLPKPDNLKSIS